MPFFVCNGTIPHYSSVLFWMVASISQSDRSYFSSPGLKVPLLMGELYLSLSYINSGNTVVLLVPLFPSVHFLCRLFHMKFKGSLETV